MPDIKDAPWIVRAETYGDPWYLGVDYNEENDEE